MLIAIDIGNTNIVIGFYKGDQLKDHFRISSRHNMTADEAGLLLTQWLERMHVSNEQIENCIIASVVPPLGNTFEIVSKRYLGCLPTIVNHELELPIKIEIDQPAQLGADRIANAVAGYNKFGGPVIIVDFGTATTFDVVSEDGAYIGGVITAGPETAMGQLAKKASQLFEVNLVAPKKIIGKNSRMAIQSGLFFGTVGQVDYIIDKILLETGFKNCKVIATGGFAKGIEGYSNHIKLIEPTLTLEGLRIIEEMN